MEFAALWARFVLGFVFLLAGMSKLDNTGQFNEAIRGYGLVPAALTRPVAMWLPRAEVAAGAALLLGIGVRSVALLPAAALVAFSVGVAVNLLQGRELDCGCFGPAAPSRITWLTVVRNAILFGLAVLAAGNAPPVLALTGRGISGITSAEALAVMALGVVTVPTALLLTDALRVMRALSTLEHNRQRVS